MQKAIVVTGRDFPSTDCPAGLHSAVFCGNDVAIDMTCCRRLISVLWFVMDLFV